MNAVTTPALGTNSEVGTLRTVMVHRPDLAHERLSPSNAANSWETCSARSRSHRLQSPRAASAGRRRLRARSSCAPNS